MPFRTALKKEYSTSTVYGEKYLVPWLASAGPLAYMPEQPPPKDYFFQYGWVLPQIFNPEVNLREHYYFGALYKDQAKILFRFWERARRGHVSQRFCELGVVSQNELKAPIAVYDHLHEPRSRRGLLIIQHGSYQWVERESQPDIESGQVLLYRGVERAPVFLHLGFEPEGLSPFDLEVWHKYLTLQAQMLSDSVLSFNTIHDRTKRCETSHLQDGTWLSDDLATQAGLAIHSPGFARKLWAATHQSYSLERWVGARKFGPHYVIFKTPLFNIRITTCFAGEAETRVIDPRLLNLVDGVGCRVESAASRPHEFRRGGSDLKSPARKGKVAGDTTPREARKIEALFTGAASGTTQAGGKRRHNEGT
jgi:hypothetical protein